MPTLLALTTPSQPNRSEIHGGSAAHLTGTVRARGVGVSKDELFGWRGPRASVVVSQGNRLAGRAAHRRRRGRKTADGELHP